MYRCCLILALLSVASTAVASQPDSASVLVYGEDHAFFVDVPHGWHQDCEAMKDTGICALFYRPGFTAATAPVIMYVNTADIDSAGIDSFIADDLEGFREDSPTLVVRRQPALKTSDGSTVRVLRLEHAGGPSTSELVGYLAQAKVTVIFVASGKSSRELDREASAFVELVRSYSWLTDVVKVRH